MVFFRDRRGITFRLPLKPGTGRDVTVLTYTGVGKRPVWHPLLRTTQRCTLPRIAQAALAWSTTAPIPTSTKVLPTCPVPSVTDIPAAHLNEAKSAIYSQVGKEEGETRKSHTLTVTYSFIRNPWIRRFSGLRGQSGTRRKQL
jgi:hypothetical protein